MNLEQFCPTAPEPVAQIPDKSPESKRDTVIKQLDNLNDSEIIAVIEAGNKILAKRRPTLPDDYASVDEDFLNVEQERTPPVPAPFVSNVLGETTETSTEQESLDATTSTAQEQEETSPVPAPSTSASKPSKTPCEELQSEIYNNIAKLYLQQAAKTDKTAAIELANFTFESKTPQDTLEECLGLKFKTFENLFEIEQLYSEKFKQLA